MADDEQSLRLSFHRSLCMFSILSSVLRRVGLELQSFDEESGDAESPEPPHVIILQLRVIRLDFRPREIAYVYSGLKASCMMRRLKTRFN